MIIVLIQHFYYFAVPYDVTCKLLHVQSITTVAEITKKISWHSNHCEISNKMY